MKKIKVSQNEMRKLMDKLISGNKIVVVGKEKNERTVRQKNEFIIFERKYLPFLFSLKRLRGPMTLYLYLWAYVNRDPNEQWGNLGKYFREGYLATLRTQVWLQKELGVPQNTLSTWFSVLEEESLIIKVGVERIKVGKAVEVANVFALGELRVINGYSEEIWYHEALSEY